jgi:hypothetical protein
MHAYTVIGYYEGTGQRFATSVTAESAAHAEVAVAEDGEEELIVVGVVQGEHPLADCSYASYIGSDEARRAIWHRAATP